jgi:hypothetical protein
MAGNFCKTVCSWDLGAPAAQERFFAKSLRISGYEEIWSLSSGVVGRRRLFVTNSLKYRDADGFLIWHSYNIIDLNE